MNSSKPNGLANAAMPAAPSGEELEGVPPEDPSPWMGTPDNSSPFLEEMEPDRIIPAEPIAAKRIESVQDFKKALGRLGSSDLMEFWRGLNQAT